MVNPHPADGKNSVLFQEVSAVRHYTAKGISNGAVGGAEKSAEAIVAPKRAKGRIGSRFKDFNHSDDGQEKRSGKPPKLGDKRRRSGVPRYGRKVSKRMWREGDPKNTSNDDGVLPKPRSARNRHASWCGRGGVPPLPDYAGHDTSSGVQVSNEPVRGNQIVEDKFTSVRMWMKEVQDEVRRTRTGNGYKAHMRVSLQYKTKPKA